MNIACACVCACMCAFNVKGVIRAEQNSQKVSKMSKKKMCKISKNKIEQQDVKDI